MDDFEDRLRIRFKKHHSRCGQCIRHRLIIKRCGHCPPAQRAQAALLEQHLARQHHDRQIYWHARAQSRLDAKNSQIFCVTGILDSMDMAKYCWPRSPTMLSKELCTFNRPKMSSTALLLHGHSCTFSLSPHNVTCNSSRTAEILAHGLTALARTHDLRSVFLHLQADNASKEVKNQTLLRICALWVARRQIKGIQLSFLSSGHSHEDVDAMFAVVRTWRESQEEILTPSEFVQCVQRWLDKPQNRPLEAGYRRATLVSQYRDWILGLCFEFF